MFENLKNIDTGAGSTLGDYKFLYGFVSMIRPKTILEIGTNHGGSAIAMAMALRDGEQTKSKIVSVDVNAGHIETARKNLEQLNLLKYVDLCLGDSSLALKYLGFDVVFIDGDHTYEGCIADFNNVRDKAKYILIHDSAQSDGAINTVNTIKRGGTYEVINLDIGESGTQWSLGKPTYHAFPGFAIIKGGK